MEDLKWFYTLAAASAFIFIAIYSASRNRRKQQKPLPPSPPSHLVIGHLHLLKIPLHKTFESLAAEYGPVFGLKLGSQYTVVVSSPAGCEECFKKNDVILADRPQVMSAKYLNWDSHSVGASNYGDHWKNVRRISNQELYSGSRLNMFQSVRQDEVKSMLKSLFYLTRQEKRKVEMKSRIIETTFRTLVRMVTGKRYHNDEIEDSPEAKEFRKMIREITRLSDVSNIADFVPFLRLIKFGGYEKEMAKVQQRTDAVLRFLINECKANKDGAVAPCVLPNLLAMQEADPESIADKTIKALLQEMITAGTDTSAASTEWTMCLLLNNPEKLEKARSEIDRIIGPGRLVDEADLPNLTYIQAIIKESMRMYPAAPLLVPHIASSECTVQGFHIPRGTMVLVNAWAIHRDHKVWNEPLNFKPERFENVDEFSYAYKLIPFGIGRRSCPGANLAQKVVGLTLASLIQCFEWERINEEEVEMDEATGLIMQKLTPLEAMCQPRNIMINVLSDL